MIVDVDVLARLGAAGHAADVLAVLDDGIALFQILERDLVADRYVVLGGDMDRRVVLGDDAEHLGSGLEVFDDDDADVVLGAMDQELRNVGLGHRPFLPRWRTVGYFRT